MKLCIDAGGTYFRYILFKDEQQVAQDSHESLGIGFGSWLEEMLLKYPDVKTVGIGYAGQVKDGVILAAPNMNVDISDIKSYFENKFDIKLFIRNDLECAVLAEAEFFKSKDTCALYLGSGMGLGVISSSVLLQGHSGVAAEIGHIPYKKSPFICGCGKDNCVELFASGTGLAKFKDYLKIDKNLSLQELRESKNELYEQFEDALLHAIGTLITIFNPEILVLGGGFFASDDILYDRVVARFREFTMPISANEVKIVKTQMQNAVLSGAIMLKEDM